MVGRKARCRSREGARVNRRSDLLSVFRPTPECGA